jgi:hypothetical protein
VSAHSIGSETEEKSVSTEISGAWNQQESHRDPVVLCELFFTARSGFLLFWRFSAEQFTTDVMEEPFTGIEQIWRQRSKEDRVFRIFGSIRGSIALPRVRTWNYYVIWEERGSFDNHNPSPQVLAEQLWRHSALPTQNHSEWNCEQYSWI